jgi:GNAT superfamily N-acetyltransferase
MLEIISHLLVFFLQITPTFCGIIFEKHYLKSTMEAQQKSPKNEPLVVERLEESSLTPADWERLTLLYRRLLPAGRHLTDFEVAAFRKTLFTKGAVPLIIRDETLTSTGSTIAAMARLQDTRTHLFRKEQDVDAMIFNVCVLPGLEGRGKAHALTRACIEGARGKRLRSIGLDVVDTNQAARRIYAKLGFKAQYEESGPLTYGQTYVRYVLELK